MNSQNKDTIESMAKAFDVRAEGYDEHMRNNVDDFHKFYNMISFPIFSTKKEIEILDLGCGTGLEIEGIFKKAPNSLVTGIDLSTKMLDKLALKYKDYIKQISLIKDSYVTYPFYNRKYDYIVSVMTMHHYLYEDKLLLYKKIKNALKKGGKYIEGDYVVSREKEKEFLSQYFQKIKLVDKNEQYHIDIPMSEEPLVKLLNEAGFSKIEIVYRGNENLVFVATI